MSSHGRHRVSFHQEYSDAPMSSPDAGDECRRGKTVPKIEAPQLSSCHLGQLYLRTVYSVVCSEPVIKCMNDRLRNGRQLALQFVQDSPSFHDPYARRGPSQSELVAGPANLSRVGTRPDATALNPEQRGIGWIPTSGWSSQMRQEQEPPFSRGHRRYQT